LSSRQVHKNLGPGFLESVYQKALQIELQNRGLVVEREKVIDVFYDGLPIGCHKLDMLVSGEVIVELKTVEELSKAHYAQIRSYLKASGLATGLLVNFAKERADFRRIEFRHPQST
jgi:GxxExxY protein